MHLNAICPICNEQLGDEHPPKATQCGHLYCNDCATFYFASADKPPCAICNAPQSFKGLVTLYPSYDTPPSSPVIPSVEILQEGNKVMELGDQLLTGSSMDLDSVETVVRSAQGIHDTLEQTRSPANADSTPLLRGVGSVLADIRTKLQELHALEKSKANRDLVERINATARRQAEAARSRAEEMIEKNRRAYKRRSSKLEEERTALQEQLDHARTSLGLLQTKYDSAMHEIASLQAEVEATKRSSLKYQKKYHALRQSIRNHKQEDDLEVV